MKVYIDTREKSYEHIANYFNEIGQPYEIKHLKTADYSSDQPNGILIERKRSILEFAANVGANHERFVRELERAKQSGEKIVIIIEEPYRAMAKKVAERAFRKLSAWVAPQDKETIEEIKTRCINEIKTANDLYLVNYWSDRKCTVQGDTIYKHCQNFIEWYGVEFIFCQPKETGRIILDLLRREKTNEVNDG